MIGLLQRVTEASVVVDGECVGAIDQGLLVLVGVQKEDTHDKVERLVERLINYRVFEDDDGKMNRSLLDINGGLLLVPQFTLAADTQKGRRPSFSSCAPPEIGSNLFDYCVEVAKRTPLTIKTGIFGADMKIALLNDGPVTFSITV